MLEEINKKIQVKTHKDIIINVFNYLVKNHKHCNCDYCQLRNKYVLAKLRLHKIKKACQNELNDWELDSLDIGYIELEKITNKLKRQKEELKQNNYVKHTRI